MGATLFVGVVAIASALAFLALRAVAARAAGVRGAQVVLGIDHRPWATVSRGRRALFAAAGPFACYVLAVALVTFGSFLSGRETFDEGSMRVVVKPNSPAAEAGFLDGDRIVSVDGVAIADWTTLQETVAKHRGEAIQVTIRRGDHDMVLTPTPGTNGRMGVAPPTAHHDVGFGAALVEGITEAPRVWAGWVKGLAQRLLARDRSELSGPVAVGSRALPEVAAGLGGRLRFAGTVASFYLWIPVLLALVFFPRSSRRTTR